MKRAKSTEWHVVTWPHKETLPPFDQRVIIEVKPIAINGGGLQWSPVIPAKRITKTRFCWLLYPDRLIWCWDVVRWRYPALGE